MDVGKALFEKFVSGFLCSNPVVSAKWYDSSEMAEVTKGGLTLKMMEAPGTKYTGQPGTTYVNTSISGSVSLAGDEYVLEAKRYWAYENKNPHIKESYSFVLFDKNGEEVSTLYDIGVIVGGYECFIETLGDENAEDVIKLVNAIYILTGAGICVADCSKASNGVWWFDPDVNCTMVKFLDEGGSDPE